MNLSKTSVNKTIIIFVEGGIDSSNSGQFESFIKKEIKDFEDIVFDLNKCEYISSAGLRVLLKVCKYLNGVGEVSVINASESIRSVLEMTGFTKIMKVDTK